MNVNKLDLDFKTRLEELLEGQMDALREFFLFLFKRILMYDKPDQKIKMIYTFFSHVFTHYSKAEKLNTANLQQLV